MKITDYTFNINELQIEHFEELLPENSLLFDIETTGFKAEYQTIYLIGVGFRNKDTLTIRLFYSPSKDSEISILQEFEALSKDYSRLISFNGEMFDIPFLLKRFEKNNLSHTFEHIASLDLFKLSKKYKRLLNLESYKQKSIEEYFGLFRKDQYNGGQLIDIYKKQSISPSSEEEKLLFLHNMEDIKGMCHVLKLLDFSILENKMFQLHHIEFDENEIIFSGEYPVITNLDFSYMSEDYFIQIKKNRIYGNIKMFIGTLKYYFKDYKNYVYVPDENLLLPKALSTSIDKSRIQKATKEQCFAAKEGMFLPNLLKLDEREFKKDFSSKETYIEIDPKEVSFRFLENYIQKIIVP